MAITKRKYHRKSLKTKKRITKGKRRNKSKRSYRTKRRNKSRKFRKSKKGGGKFGKKKLKQRKRRALAQKPPIYQLFTDVDDTLHPAGILALGHLEMAGVDRSGSRHEFYDCVAQLHQQIQAQNGGLPTIIISADPREKSPEKIQHLKDALGIEEIEAWKGNLISSGFSIIQNLGCKVGEICGIKETDPDNSQFKSMANVKVNQITAYVTQKKSELLRQGRRYRPIWIGDNGQGDLLAAKTLLQNKIIYAALIHNVDPNKSSGKSSSWYRNNNPPRLFPFKNYGQAIDFLKNYEGLQNLTSCSVANESPHHVLRQQSFQRQEERETSR